MTFKRFATIKDLEFADGYRETGVTLGTAAARASWVITVSDAPLETLAFARCQGHGDAEPDLQAFLLDCKELG